MPPAARKSKVPADVSTLHKIAVHIPALERDVTFMGEAWDIGDEQELNIWIGTTCVATVVADQWIYVQRDPG